MAILSNTLIQGTLLLDPGEGILVNQLSVGVGMGDYRILEDEDIRDIEDGDDRILETDT